MTIDLRIDEIVLHGFAPADRHRIGDAFQRELTRLLAAEGVPPAWASGGPAAQVDAGAFTVAPGARPEIVGAQVARAVYAGGAP